MVDFEVVVVVSVSVWKNSSDCTSGDDENISLRQRYFNLSAFLSVCPSVRLSVPPSVLFFSVCLSFSVYPRLKKTVATVQTLTPQVFYPSVCCVSVCLPVGWNGRSSENCKSFKSCLVRRFPGCCYHGLTSTWWGCCGLCLWQGLWHKQPSLLTSFLFCSCVCFYLYGPFNCISFHKFSKQLFAFSLCSFGLIFALLVLSTTYLFMKVSLSPDIIFLVYWA